MLRELVEQLVGTTKAPVAKDEDAWARGAGKWLVNSVLPPARAPEPRREHRVGAAFAERDDADRRQGRLSPPGVVTPNAARLLGASARSRTVPSIDTSRRPP